MPVGDSITKGSGTSATLTSGGYRQKLFEDLTGSPYNFKVDFVGNKAEPSGTSFDNNYNGGSGYFARNNSVPSMSVFHLIGGWLDANPPDIILLHIGTNDVTGGHASASEIADILNVVDTYETDHGTDIYVVLALITNRLDNSGNYFDDVSILNTSVNSMAQGRTGDLIKVVDMENALSYPADLASDLLHLVPTGYSKMANLWLAAVADLCLSKPIVTGPGNKTFAEGVAVNESITATDPDNDAIVEFGASNLPPGLTINTNTGLISGMVSYDAFTESTYQITLTAEDDTGAVGSAIYSWNITNTNRAPQVAKPANQSHAEGASVSLQVTASDPDVGNAVQFSVSNLPPGLAINSSSGWITGVISYDVYTGTSYTVLVTATDNGSPAMSDSESFTWTVANTNRLPEFDVLPGDQSDSEGDTVSLQIQASDPDPDDSLVFSASGLPDGLGINPATGLISGVLSYKASNGSPYPVSVTASDGTGQATANFTWQVSDRNGPPQLANPGDQTDAEMHPVHLELQVSDPDLNDSLSFSLGAGSFLPAGIYLNPDTGLITGQIASGASSDSPYTVTVIVKDNGLPLLSAQVTFDWNIVPFNYPPGNSTLFLPLILH